MSEWGEPLCAGPNHAPIATGGATSESWALQPKRSTNLVSHDEVCNVDIGVFTRPVLGE